MNNLVVRKSLYSFFLMAALTVGASQLGIEIVFAQDFAERSNAPLTVQYLEVVTNEIGESVALYSQIYDVTFGEAEPNLGNARTAKLIGGGLIGIREPLRDDELPIVRSYILVDDITVAVEGARVRGSEIALDVTSIEGFGQIAVVIQNGIEAGLWQLDEVR